MIALAMAIACSSVACMDRAEGPSGTQLGDNATPLIELVQHTERRNRGDSGATDSALDELYWPDGAASIRRCWNVDPNAGDTPPVEVVATLDRSGRVIEAHVVDEALYASDRRFRAAADSALRAVLNPACQPFPLPPDQWPSWQTIRFNFDPADFF